MSDITKRANELIDKIKSLDMNELPTPMRSHMENVLGLLENTLKDDFDYRVESRDCDIAESAIKVFWYLAK